MSEQEITRPCGQRPPRTDRERFYQRCAEQDCGYETQCWIWLYSRDPDGYGRFKIGRSQENRAHRWAYEHFVGPIPKGLVIDHLCRNHACVNPAHLEPVTCRVNLMRGETRAAKAAAQTRCMHGHAFDADNTYVTASGSRQCRACHRRRRREHRLVKAAA